MKKFIWFMHFCFYLLVSHSWAKAFSSIWDTQGSNDPIVLPLVEEGIYDFTVDWGDSSNNIIKSYNQLEKSHTYAPAIYTINIITTF